MSKRILSMLLPLLLTLTVPAQELTVKEMKATNDISASQYYVNDLTSKPCALVKVQLPLPGAVFEGNVIQPVDYKTNEYWVYMPEGSKELHVKHPNYQTLVVNFPDFGVKSLQSLSTYRLSISIPQSGTAAQTQKLTINYTPSNATVLIDSKLYKGNGRIEAQLAVGSHDYIIAADGFVTAEGSVKLTANGPRTINETLATITTTQQPSSKQPQSLTANHSQSSFEDAEIDGLTPAQINSLGYDYHIGRNGKAIDMQKAAKYYRIAAEQGDSYGQCNLGYMYEKGFGDTQDYVEAVKWYRKSAEQGNANGQCNLGNMYKTGKGVTQDNAEAVKWYRKSAEQGNAEGQNNLGAMYHNGTGVAKDLNQAKYWYEKAAAQGHKTAEWNLKLLNQSKSFLSSSVETFTVKGVSFNMVRVDGGTFMMGATSEQGSDAYPDEKPIHKVKLSPYSIGETEVTQTLWQTVMGDNPSNFKGDNLPVESVSWEDCQSFISKLNQLTGKQFRLPTEAEWEYAARGGSKSHGYKYSGSNDIGAVAWFKDNSGSKTHNVKTKQSNELGLYDMIGNVWEWCQDWHRSYSSSSQTNPTGPKKGSYRIIRGGCWYDSTGYCRSSSRFINIPSYQDYCIGLRLAL